MTGKFFSFKYETGKASRGHPALEIVIFMALVAQIEFMLCSVNGFNRLPKLQMTK